VITIGTLSKDDSSFIVDSLESTQQLAAAYSDHYKPLSYGEEFRHFVQSTWDGGNHGGNSDLVYTSNSQHNDCYNNLWINNKEEIVKYTDSVPIFRHFM
jgi:hypothetical protein